MPSIMTLQGPRLGAPPAQPQAQLLGISEQVAQHPILALIGIVGGGYLAYRAVGHARGHSIAGLAGKVSREAKACISDEIAAHCEKKPGRCASGKERKQAVAIGYSICKRRGFRSIPPPPKR